MIVRGLRTKPVSLRARATSWYVGLLAVALIVFSVGVYVGVRTYLKQTMQRALGGTAQTIASDFLTKLPAKGDAWVLGELRESYAATPTDRYVRLTVGHLVFYRTGDMHRPSIRLSDVALPLVSDVGAIHRQTTSSEVVMTYSIPFQSPDGRLFEIEAGASLFAMDQTLRSLERILTLATVTILIAAIIGGYLLMELPLRPLVVLAVQAEDIGRKGLGDRLPVIETGDELERLTHSLNRMIDRLEDSLAHNYRFSADASHELRTPLTIMRGEIEEMLSIDGLPSLAVENLVSTIEEIDRMSRIVNSLMTITRLDAGGERMDMKTLDLSTLVRTTTEHMRLLAEEKRLHLACVCQEGVHVYADPMRIKQVLVNLIDNAIKYTPEAEAQEALCDRHGPIQDEASSGARPRSGSLSPASVTVTLAVVGNEVQLRIADRGIGITAEALPFVFDRFYRADFARSRVAGGVGLGLAIVKAIVVAHEGTVSIASAEGEGSTVCIQLPLMKALQALEPTESQSALSHMQSV